MSNHAADRMILAVRAGDIPVSYKSAGFHSLDSESMLGALKNAGYWIGPRQTLETLEDFRQIIPYIVLSDGERFVCYERSTAGGEARLHGRLSIGLGGHIDFSDVVRSKDTVDLDATMSLSARRELDEELSVSGDVDFDWLGLILEDDTPVSRVHIGVVGFATLDRMTVASAEDAIDNVRLLTLEELLENEERLEGWSQRLLPYLTHALAEQSKQKQVA